MPDGSRSVRFAIPARYLGRKATPGEFRHEFAGRALKGHGSPSSRRFRPRGAPYPEVVDLRPYHSIAASLALAAALSPLPSAARPAATTVAAPSRGVPFEILACSVDTSWTGADLSLRVRNLDASRALQRLTVSLSLADDVGVRQAVVPHEFRAIALAPGESADLAARDLSVPVDSTVRARIRSAKCRFVSATYDGGATWKPGKPWRGKLIPTNASPSP
jgi:hypothetical protein